MFKGIFEKITDQKDPNDYDPEQLKAGTDIELEHTDDRELAKKLLWIILMNIQIII